MIPLFQRIPHFNGSNAGEDDLWLPIEDEDLLLSEEVWVTEKLDGIAISIMRTGRRGFGWEIRPAWRDALDGAVAHALSLYLHQRYNAIHELLEPRMVLYGEWLWFTLSIQYTALPDLFICYAIEDQKGRLLDLEEMQARCKRVGLTPVEPIWRGVLGNMETMKGLVGTSQFAAPHRMEGLIVEPVKQHKAALFGKWVEPDYTKPTPEGLSGQRNLLK